MGNDKHIEATKEGRQSMRLHSDSVDTSELMRWIDNFNVAISDLRTAWQPGLALELALAKCITGSPSIDRSHTEMPRSNKKETPPVSVEVEKKLVEPVVVARTETKPEPHITEPLAKETGPVAGGEVTIDLIRSNWAAIRAEVKKMRRPQTEALLNSQKSLQVRSGTLYIGFDGEVLKQKMGQPENLQPTQQAIKQVVGLDVPIVCEITSSKAAKPAADIDVDPDGLVGTAMNLGGKLVHRK
jgi:DNA polymerase-3 subunit gamma/tau